MQFVRALPLYVLLLAACSEPPPSTPQHADLSPGVHCQEICAAGFRWAVANEITDEVKCRADGDYGRGCREAVAALYPYASE
ncbi:MAG: hypothetical protein ACOY41_01865 [Pseudomonadota bacterium]